MLDNGHKVFILISIDLLDDVLFLNYDYFFVKSFICLMILCYFVFNWKFSSSLLCFYEGTLSKKILELTCAILLKVVFFIFLIKCEL